MASPNGSALELLGPGNDVVLGSLLEGVAIIDASRRVTYANAAAARMVGSSADELVGKPYDLAFFQFDKSASEDELSVCPINFSLSEGTPSRVPDAVFIKADGESFDVEYVCTPLGEPGKVTAVLLSFQDVTQRREVEIAIADARDAALQAAKTKAAFLANISHEIRTPLSGIVGTANLLADTSLSAEQQNYVDMLKQSIGSLLETVNDILDFSKIEAGKLRLHSVTFDLRKLIDETITLYRSSAEAKHLELRTEIADDLRGSFRGDSNRIRQILNNLISNAIKFTHAGSVVVRARRLATVGDMIRFEVEDTGIGVAEDQLSHLFQPFTQGDTSTTRRFGGTGLGLAISRELATMMGGEIGVESVAGRGSTFWFVVRITAESVPDSVESIHVSEGPANKFRVLLAEDHPISSQIIRTMLEQAGCRVTLASDGARAIETAMTKRFDLILMDCQMPEIDGYAATGAIRESGGPNRETTIIALSAHSVEIERGNSLRAGLDDFLSKPLTRGDLARMFEKHFGDRFKISNLDLDENLIQHFLAKNVTPEVAENFRTIEARGEKDFVAEIFRTYFSFTAAELATIESEFKSGQTASVKRRAHALKGSSANVGLDRMRQLSARLEQVADREEAESVIAAIEGEFTRLNDEFLKL